MSWVKQLNQNLNRFNSFVDLLLKGSTDTSQSSRFTRGVSLKVDGRPQLVIAPILKLLAGKWRVNVILSPTDRRGPSQRAQRGRPWLGGNLVSEPHVHFNVLKQLRASERVPEMPLCPSQVICNGREKKKKVNFPRDRHCATLLFWTKKENQLLHGPVCKDLAWCKTFKLKKKKKTYIFPFS